MEVEGRLMEVGMFKGGEGRKMGDEGGSGRGNQKEQIMKKYKQA